MNRVKRLARSLVLIAPFLALAGCATVEEQLVLPQPTEAKAVTVTLSDNSSFRFTDPQRVQAVANHLKQYEEGWQKSWGGRPQNRYRVSIEQSNGDYFDFVVNTDSLSLNENGGRQLGLSEAALRGIDRAILGEDPYSRFPALDFKHPG